MLMAEIESRQQVLNAGGFLSVSDQRAGVPPVEQLPYILLLLDSWEGFNAAFEGLDGGRLVSSLQHVLREGSGAGIVAVLTGDRSLLLGRMATLADFRLVLRFNDQTSFSLAGLNPRALPDHIPPGRAFRVESGREIQVALIDRDVTGPGQVAAIQRASAAATESAADIPRTSPRCTGRRAPE